MSGCCAMCDSIERMERAVNHDYRTERGYVVALIDPTSGRTMQESEMFISTAGAERWLQEQIASAKRLGRAITYKIRRAFEDPDRWGDSIARMCDAVERNGH